jgi:hypothetical protein
MPKMTGTVVIAQESRFQLIDDDGAGHLFILSPAASAEPQQLYGLQERQARVRVSYTNPPRIIGLLAQKIVLLDKETPA